MCTDSWREGGEDQLDTFRCPYYGGGYYGTLNAYAHEQKRELAKITKSELMYFMDIPQVARISRQTLSLAILKKLNFSG